MKPLPFANRVLGLIFFCITATSAQAGIPLWSFSPITSPVVSVGATGTATVSYTISNNSKKPHRLVLSSQTATGIYQLGGPCILAAKSLANPNPTCTLILSIDGNALPENQVSGGPVLCQADSNDAPNPNQCYKPSLRDTLVITRTTIPGATTLSTSVPSPSILALSVNNPSLNTALTGNARQIVITNTGSSDAIGLNISYPTWPGGIPATTALSDCGSTLAMGATCTIVISPGSDATSNCTTGIVPTPGTITVSATNVATAVTSNVVILGYGCQYQDGFLYSVDDTTNNGVTGTCSSPPCEGNIGGKVASLTDQAAPYTGVGPNPPTSIIWSSNGIGGTTLDTSVDVIPFIAETSTVDDSYAAAQTQFNLSYSNTLAFPFPPLSAFQTCIGAIDGRCNSSNILALYDTYNTGYGIGILPYTLSAGPTNRTYYAAGLCTGTWYLPAICEMDALNTFVTCPSGTQSMLNSLPFLLGDPNSPTPSDSCAKPAGTIDCLAGFYWSSTESSVIPEQNAWFEFFAAGAGSSGQGPFTKYAQFGVRCSRDVIP